MTIASKECETITRQQMTKHYTRKIERRAQSIAENATKDLKDDPDYLDRLREVYLQALQELKTTRPMKDQVSKTE